MALGSRFINIGLCTNIADLAQQVSNMGDEIEASGGAGLSAGCGIAIADGVIAAAVDGLTIGCNEDSKLYAIGGGSDYFAGNGLELTTSPNTFNVLVDGTTIEFNEDNELTVIMAAVEYTAGWALELAGNEFRVLTDGITIAVNGSNELEVMTVPVDLDQGDGIRIGTPSPGIEIAVELAPTPGLEFSSAKLRAKVDPVGGIERVAAGLKDKWPYRIVQGQATTNYHPGTGTVSLDHVISVCGEEITSGDSDVINCKTQENIYLDNNETVYAIYCEDPESGLTSNWSICTALNFTQLLKGYEGFDPAKNEMQLRWDKTSPGKLKWVPSSSRIEGTVTANVLESDSTMTLTITKLVDGILPAGSTVTVNNTFGWSLTSGAKVRAERTAATGEWDAYQAACS